MHEQSLYTAEEKESSALEVPMAEQAFLLFLLTTHISLYVILYIYRERETHIYIVYYYIVYSLYIILY